jgi:methyl-accepting chemotaxis protein
MNASEPGIPRHVTIANEFFIATFSLLVLFSAGLAPWFGTWTLFFLVALPAAALPSLLIFTAPNALYTKFSVAAALMIFCGLNIDQAHGMIEMHFGVFVLLSLLLIYQDWQVIVVGAGVIAVHHLLFNYLQAAHYSIWVFAKPDFAMVLVHAAYVVVESAALWYLAAMLAKNTAEISESRARLQGNFDSMRAFIGQADLGIDGLTTASDELATSSRAIADGAGKQAASLEKTAASLQQITATVRQSAEMAGQAKRLASSSEQAAQQAGSIVSQAITSMGEINKASLKIAEIISTINDIAFQTNLLAVNAAVEAARAGEDGRGFAVVAGEVRSLAQRTSIASKEIKLLIQNSMDKLGKGTEMVDRSGQSLSEIVNLVRDVGQMVAQIATASAEQSAGVEEVNSALAQIDRVTQTNSAQTEKLAETSASLSQRTAGLMVLVREFNTTAESEKIPEMHSLSA